MKKTWLLVFYLILLVGLFSFGQTINATTPEAPKTTGGTTVDLSEVNPLGVSGVSGINIVIGRVISAILGITGSVALFMFVYGGIMLLTSAGQDAKIQTGKKIITWAIIGILVILGSYVIVNFIFSGLAPKGTT